MRRIPCALRQAAVFVVGALFALSLFPTSAFADGSRIVTMGADLTAEQRATVLSFFGLTESDLAAMSLITVTNADERARLEGTVDVAQIGNKTYSCSYIEPTTSGGIYVKTANLTYVTNLMLYNALQTAGVRDCNLVVTAPFPVSGTGALTGVFMAYESAGIKLDQQKEDMATQELVTTAELGETYGGDIAEVMSDVKDTVISTTADLTDDQIRDIVRTAALAKGISLSDADVDKIVQLLRQLQDMDYDLDAFALTLSDFEARLREVTEQAQQAGVLDAIVDFFKGIANWFRGLFSGDNAHNVPTADEVTEGARDFFSDFDTSVFQWDASQ